MSGVGNMLMYALGSLDLEALTGNFLGSTQFKKVCLIAAVAMTVAQLTSCWAVTERVLVADMYVPIPGLRCVRLIWSQQSRWQEPRAHIGPPPNLLDHPQPPAAYSGNM